MPYFFHLFNTNSACKEVIQPTNSADEPDYYQPALTWKARLASCRLLPADWNVGYGQAYTTPRAELIGVIPVGYGDGLRRDLHRKFPGNQIIIDGQKCPVVGRLCLDQMMVRLPRPYPMGEEVVIIGQQREASIWVHDLAALYQTSQVDVTTLIHSRVPRIYKKTAEQIENR